MSSGAEDIIDYEEGLMIADRYEELYDKCITEDERNELYWKTLKEAILKKYELANNRLNYSKEDPKDYGFLNEDYSIDDFIQDYLYNPPEYIKEKKDLKYGQFDFNIFRIPDYYTFDYLDINNKDFDKLSNAYAAAKNSVLKAAYKSASGKKTFVWTIDEFAAKSEKVLASKDNYFLITKNPIDMAKILVLEGNASASDIFQKKV